ncbi:F-box [Hyphodiscus hymeniophilus]|uniref:F-box n=1 Tax=Hyphodiscus hymeniophilus TaxID=353542 RepID=A0A9P6VLD2_9HELO|nr:F-box [Hyphodiscus hymeniophilus]
MALDLQSNWDVSMSQPFRVPIQSTKQESSSSSPAPGPYLKPPSSEILLPTEIISHILSYIPQRNTSQGTFWACSLVSRAWYSASIKLLYAEPHLHGGNFSEFVTTVCPSKNAHIRQSSLAVLVRRLDMGELVHNSSRSLTARLLGRLKHNIEAFVAPQASFAINSFAALSKCTRLRHLDLSLISASIPPKLLFQTLLALENLETLFFPRSSGPQTDGSTTSYAWPPKLKALHLAGWIDSNFLRTHITHAPKSLERLSIQHCPQVYAEPLLETLSVLGHRLRHLTIRHPMPQLQVGVLGHVLLLCPNLLALRISADYISSSLFQSIEAGHPLRILDLDCSGTATADVEIAPGAVYDAVEDGRLPDLRSVRVSARLAWTATERLTRDVEDLVEILEEGEMERPVGVPAGVWTTYE